MNGKLFVVPMATEEPSVIAAVSNASKVWLINFLLFLSWFSSIFFFPKNLQTITGSEGGGFIATHSERSILAGQIQILDIKDLDLAEKKVWNNYSYQIYLYIHFLINI